MIHVKAGQKYRCPLHSATQQYPPDVFFIIDSIDSRGTVYYRYAPESEWYPQMHGGIPECSNPLRVFETWIARESLILVNSAITIET